MYLQILGSKGLAPTRSKRARKYAQCRIVDGKVSVTIDAGNAFRHRPSLLLITHLHEDHIDQFHTVPERTLVFVPDKSFIQKLLRKNNRVKIIRIDPGKAIKFKGFKIIAFQVPHSSTTKTFGFRIEKRGIKLVWLPDFRKLSATISYLKSLDFLFLNASALKKDIEHRNRERHGQQAVMNSLMTLKKNKISPGKIFLIHYGIGMAPLDVKTEYVNKQFPDFDIQPTWDGKIIKL